MIDNWQLNREGVDNMVHKAGEQEKVTGIECSAVETAKLFSCLSLDNQDELLSIMREMVKTNQAAQATA